MSSSFIASDKAALASPPIISRQRLLGILAAGLATISSCAASGQFFPRPDLEEHELAPDVYWVSGGRSNCGFVVGDDGTIVFDSLTTPLAAGALRETIGGVTKKPVTALFTSHGDPDHVGGIPGYPNLSTTVMHENTLSVITASIADAANGGPFGDLYLGLRDFRPTKTIAGSERMQVHGVTIDIFYYGPAHTSADLVFYLPESKIVFAGDLLAYEGRFPVIHVEGSTQGWIDAITRMLELDAEYFVPGHGELQPRSFIEAHLQTARQRRADVKAMVDSGASLDKVLAALPEEPGDPRFETFTEIAFRELKEGYPRAQPPWANMRPEFR